MCSLFDKSFRTIAYVITLHQVHLSQMTKHWDGFVSTCICCYSHIPMFSIVNYHGPGLTEVVDEFITFEEILNNLNLSAAKERPFRI